MAKTADTTSTRGGLIEMSQHQAVQVVLLGIGLGVGAWVLSELIRRIILVPLFCGDPSGMVCANAPDFAANIAAIIVVVAGLMGLVRLSVYRPLLIALAVFVSLWGLGGWTSSLAWYESLAWFVILYALCYMAFAWLVRPQSFVPTIVSVIVAVVLIRWLPLL